MGLADNQCGGCTQSCLHYSGKKDHPFLPEFKYYYNVAAKRCWGTLFPATSQCRGQSGSPEQCNCCERAISTIQSDKHMATCGMLTTVTASYPVGITLGIFGKQKGLIDPKGGRGHVTVMGKFQIHILKIVKLSSDGPGLHSRKHLRAA